MQSIQARPQRTKPQLKLSIRNYHFSQNLGKGACAQVYKGMNLNNGMPVAIKAIQKQLFKRRLNLREMVLNEVSILKACKSKNVISFIEAFENTQYFFIVTSLCNQGTLGSYIKAHLRIQESLAVKFLKEILNGFKGLHELGVVHRDIKTENIFLHQNSCVIGDLGIAKQLVENENGQLLTNSHVGTPLNMAPEIFTQQSYDSKVDIWSLGIVFYQMLFGCYPFEAENHQALYQISKKGIQNFPKGIRISPQAQDFLRKCLDPVATKRISWKQIYQHKLIKGQLNILNMYADLKKSIQLVKKPVVSDASMQQNKDFYEELDVQTLNTTLPKQYQQNLIVSNVEEDFKIIQSQSKIKQVQYKLKTAEAKREKFESQVNTYMKKMNNFMFPQKIIFPKLNDIKSILVLHQQFVFILCKKTYKDMQIFLKNIKEKNNIFNFDQKYFQEFSSSQFYDLIIQKIKECVKQLEIQCQAYAKKIKFSNQKVKDQFNLKQELIQNQLVRQISSFQENIAIFINNENPKKPIPTEEKSRSYMLLKAISFYKLKFDKDISIIQEFEKDISSISEQDLLNFVIKTIKTK